MDVLLNPVRPVGLLVAHLQDGRSLASAPGTSGCVALFLKVEEGTYIPVISIGTSEMLLRATCKLPSAARVAACGQAFLRAFASEPSYIDTETTDMQRELCAAALPHVQKLGWSQGALLAGASDLGLSPAIIGILPRKESNLVEYLIQQQNQKLVDELGQLQVDLLAMWTPQRIAAAVHLRLEMLVPYINSWPQALAILARPRNALPALQLLASLVDDIWYAAGDKSVDASWYTKRLLLAGVYSSTELYMLTDFSPGFQDTWAHLDRRLQDVATLGKAAAQVSSLSNGLLDVLGRMRQQQEDATVHSSARGTPGSSSSSNDNGDSSSSGSSNLSNASPLPSSQQQQQTPATTGTLAAG